jgi:death-on-curing protein
VKIDYLEYDDLVFLAKRHQLGQVSDVGALDAACARARSRVFGQDAYPSLELKAAALVHSLCRVPGLTSGNGHLAVSAGGTFLRINGARFDVPEDEAVELAVGVTEGRLDLHQIADVLTN